VLCLDCWWTVAVHQVPQQSSHVPQPCVPRLCSPSFARPSLMVWFARPHEGHPVTLSPPYLAVALNVLKVRLSPFATCVLLPPSWLTMPQPRSIDKSAQRHRLASKIEILGLPTMAPCPQCLKKPGSICIVREGYARCSNCVKKNVQCGGTFSDAEFDSLENRKTELRQKSVEVRNQLRALAHQLLAAQRLQESLEKQLDNITAKQSEMVDREARLLGELDSFDPDQQIAFMSDDFSLDDPTWSAFVSGLDGGTDQQVQG